MTQTQHLWQLSETNLRATALTLAECPRCHGEKFYVTSPRGRKSGYEQEYDCNCADYRASFFDDAGFPDSFHGKTLANLNWSVLQPPALVNAIHDYVDHLDEFSDEGIGLVLQGEFGNGKTHIAVGIGKIFCALGRTVRFLSLPEWLNEARAALAAQEYDNHRAQIAELGSVDLVILDDMGFEQPTPWARETLHRLINRREVTCKPVVITTNLDGEAFERHFGGGIFSRLWGNNLVLSFHGEDFRLQRARKRVESWRSRWDCSPEIKT